MLGYLAFQVSLNHSQHHLEAYLKQLHHFVAPFGIWELFSSSSPLEYGTIILAIFELPTVPEHPKPSPAEGASLGRQFGLQLLHLRFSLRNLVDTLYMKRTLTARLKGGVGPCKVLYVGLHCSILGFGL